ncbi:acyltransferase [Mycobacterium antarcticum]|uniref:condensation domain-containing protein n=1 Tax=unclassified Mycolicibacterium TaxID=2636767 RepID=UPI0023826538|nr:MULTISPECIES: condensation domain-containing protein [unclassified Mycolicibacterium]BDX32570.1 acyltransferase [Mycolicibacterium sp. TUM20985]GLP75779.1 acyltransferase [Mycolicibacterium sp. TUM20983]GLP83880.1 acyltransferase [Mycolicibacterium sp. TUM20984]
MVAIKAIHDWNGTSGCVVSWHPSPVSRVKVRNAPVSNVPPSYQQAQHIRGYLTHESMGSDMARLNIPAWDMPGQCDVRAMTHVVNAYLRRHDTYHSWFEMTDSGEIVRHTVDNPRDIAFVPTKHGEMTATEWREHVLSTPDPLQWDCFSFGVIQRADHFTFYISVDHVHTDAMFMGVVLLEIHMMYAALASGGAPIPLPAAGSYDEYCVRQHDFLSSLTLETPAVQEWVDFARCNDGTMPQFPMPLGDPPWSTTGDLVTVRLMDKPQSDRFEAACTAAGARFIGGVFACAAMAQHAVTGSTDYHVITPTTTRQTPEEFQTTGWFTGVVPVSVSVDPASFAATAKAAQVSFDGRMPLGPIPFDRVLELADESVGLRKPAPGVPMVSYLDAGLPPLSASIIAEWERMNGKVYSDARSAYQIGIWVNRSERETSVTVAFPNNPIARESIDRYLAAMTAAYLGVAEGVTTAPARAHVRHGEALRRNAVRDLEPLLPMAKG